MVMCGLCGIGMKTFSQTDAQEKLWVPQSSRIIDEKGWVDVTFPQETRYATYIAISSGTEEGGVLTPQFINAVSNSNSSGSHASVEIDCSKIRLDLAGTC